MQGKGFGAGSTIKKKHSDARTKKIQGAEYGMTSL